MMLILLKSIQVSACSHDVCFFISSCHIKIFLKSFLFPFTSLHIVCTCMFSTCSVYYKVINYSTCIYSNNIVIEK